jgi:hypothetical protein
MLKRLSLTNLAQEPVNCWDRHYANQWLKLG